MSVPRWIHEMRDAWVAAQADPRSGSSAQHGRDHNPRIIESRMQGNIA
jgi:hypothetical protein